MSEQRRPISAAGAVLWRGVGEDLVVAVAHRPRYDDWSLPKGKVEPGESLLATAVREVQEETGAQTRVGRRLITTHYGTSGGPKQVSYWSMEFLGGDFVANDEVDELRWVSPAEADRIVSYDDDRTVLADFGTVSPHADVVLLVRHAKAGKRSAWKGDDRLRPLDRMGRRQARHAADVLTWFRPGMIAAADRVRCEQTVAPLAADLAMTVHSRPEFSDESQSANPRRALTALRDLAELHHVVAVCSQGGAIPAMLEDLDRSGAPYPSRKGSVWVLSLVEGTLVAADYYSHPHP